MVDAELRERRAAYAREYRRKLREGEPTAPRGVTNLPEYSVWQCMRRRCSSPTDRAFANYGGRGIRVCLEWDNGFDQFLRDMGPRPSPKHSIDRIDNDGNYEPSNCRWATKQEQQNNTRLNHKVIVRGETMNLRQALMRYGVPAQTYRNRTRQGWSDERALITPPATGPNAKRNFYGTCP